MSHNNAKAAAGKNKIFVVIVALIFLGSMAGALLYSTGPSSNNAELPASKIIQGLSDAEKQRILFGTESNPSDRHVLITLTIPKICDMDCNRARNVLEQMVSAYDPAVYLAEVNSGSSSLDIQISTESYRGKNDFSGLNQTAVEDFICENSVYRLDECVIRKMEFGAFNGNETGNEKNETQRAAGSGNAGNATASNSTAGGTY